MSRAIKIAEVGARGIDSLPFSQSGTDVQAKALKAAGIDFVVGYLGAMSPSRVTTILSAGLSFMPVTFGNQYDGTVSANQCSQLNLPKGCTVWLDLEGKSAFDMAPVALCKKINVWAAAIIQAGYMPGLYVGSPQPLTSEELYNLKVVRYWNALSREADRNGKLAEPKCGWCMWQMYPSVTWRGTGVWSDVNIIGADFQGRLPSWVVSSS